MKTLKPLQTPWDDMPREQLVREMQKAYSAIISAMDVLHYFKEIGDSTSRFWQSPEGRGGRAIARVDAVIEPYKQEYTDWQFYQTFFRTTSPLIFPDIEENWVICEKCGTMTQSNPENDAKKIGKTCSEGNFGGQGNCDGTLRWMTWEDIEKWKKEYEAQPVPE